VETQKSSPDSLPTADALSAKLEGEVVVMRDALTRLSLAMQDYLFEVSTRRQEKAEGALQNSPRGLSNSH